MYVPYHNLFSSLVQGISKRLFPGCVKSSEKVAFCLPSAGRITLFFHYIFLQPEKSLIEVPCTSLASFSKKLADGRRPWRALHSLSCTHHASQLLRQLLSSCLLLRYVTDHPDFFLPRGRPRQPPLRPRRPQRPLRKVQ